MDLFQSNHNKKSIDLSFNSDFDIHKFLEFLSNHKEISNIKLMYSMIPCGEHITNNHMVKILTFFKAIYDKKLDYLESIDLSNNHLGKTYFIPPTDDDEYNFLLRWTWVPVTKIYTGFINTWRYYYSPTENPAYDIKPPCSLIAYFSKALSSATMINLTKISLMHTAINDDDLEEISKALLEGVPNLSNLDLSTNRLTYLGVEHLVDVIKYDKLKKLEDINLSNNYIDNTGACALLGALLAKSIGIKVIRLSNNIIDDGASYYISSIIPNLRTLEILSITHNKFSNDSFINITNAAGASRSIVSLHISLTDEEGTSINIANEADIPRCRRRVSVTSIDYSFEPYNEDPLPNSILMCQIPTDDVVKELGDTTN